MCGIFGYIGSKNPVNLCLEGLKKLEYRGYDSSGIAGIKGSQILHCKERGKVAVLETLIEKDRLDLDLAISHTRWATHGKPDGMNAHPHFDEKTSLALVHNGIIENYDEIRKRLREKGFNFTSETDSEVVAHLIGDLYQGDILKAVQDAVPLLSGSYAIALIHRDHPNQIIALANESPLAIGIGNGEMFISSDASSFSRYTREVIFLEDAEIAVIRAEGMAHYDATRAEIERKSEVIAHQSEDASKGDFEHYTLKEIHEQPQTVRNALLSRYMEEFGNVILDGLNFSVSDLLEVKSVLILACGTSWHAGAVAAYMLEDRARIPVQVEISSEFRYKNPIVRDGTLVIAISQSGETADTIAAVRELKEKGARILSVCNSHGSTLVRESEGTLFLRAGAEIGVCSTKAFTSQLVVLSLFTVMMARMRHMSQVEGQEFLAALKKIPEQVEQVLAQSSLIKNLAKKYASYDNFFFLGRNYMYPAALEGALKLKEISYINANGYPAGEMKHGPIALINEQCPTVAFCANQITYTKMLSNLKEVKARGGEVIAIVDEKNKEITEVVDDVIFVPHTIDELAPIASSVAAQLFAYYIARERGTDIDQPRNLAKSVTVE